MKKIIQTTEAPKPVGPYSQAVQAGDFLFISGQLPIDPKVGKIAATDIAGQTRQVMENVKAILSAADYTLSEIVQTTIYLTSMADFEEFNREYAKYFTAQYPARATVACLLKAGALLEVAAVAYKAHRD